MMPINSPDRSRAPAVKEAVIAPESVTESFKVINILTIKVECKYGTVLALRSAFRTEWINTEFSVANRVSNGAKRRIHTSRNQIRIFYLHNVPSSELRF